jgi:hypothetical protein
MCINIDIFIALNVKIYLKILKIIYIFIIIIFIIFEKNI